MKNLLSIFFLITAFVFSGCSNDDDNVVTYDATFNGNLLLSGSVISTDSECKVSITGDVAEITLYGTSFAPGMPARDIVIPALKSVQTATGFIITGENVTPVVNGEPNDKYTFTEVNAVINGSDLELSAKMPMGTIGFTTEDSSPSQTITGASSFSGRLSVGEFSKDAVVDVIPDYETSLLTVVINDAKFASNMPFEIDITVKDIPFVVEEDGTIGFSENDVDPYMNTETEPSSQYRFAVFSGSIDNGSVLHLSARMSDGLAPYLAGMSFVFEGGKIIE